MRPTSPRGRSAGFSLPFLTIAVVATAVLAGWLGWWAPLAALALVAALMFGVPMLAGSPSAQDTDGLGADAARPPVDDGGPAHADPAGSLADQLCFLGDCLARDDRDALRRACAPDEPAPIHDLAFDWLRARHDARSLTRLYRGRRFPTEPGTFTLGGHDRELGHVHVEFRSDDGARWRLGKLWMCR